MTSGVAAVALAASALFALPAAADAPAARATVATKIGNDASLVIQVGHDDRYRGGDYRGRRDGYRLNRWGQSPREVERLTNDAIRACRQEVQYTARRAGYRDVDFESRARTDQIGPYGFSVFFRNVEFERGRHDIDSRVSCTIRQGRVTDVDGVPHNRRGAPPPRRR